VIEAERGRRGFGYVRKATLLSTVKTAVYHALELSEAELGVDCSCMGQRACIQHLGIYISIA
jgi:hypothetical protein